MNDEITIFTILKGVILGHKKVFGAIAAFVVAIVVYNIFLGYNSATQLLVKQAPNGTLSCIDHAGFYFKGPFVTIYSYDRTKDFYFNSSTEKVRGGKGRGRVNRCHGYVARNNRVLAGGI